MQKLTIRQAFKTTQDYFKISGKDLSQVSGIGTPHISSFRNGKNWISEDTLEKLLDGMEELAPGSRRYFGLLVSGGSEPNLEDLIEIIGADRLMVAIAEKFKKDRETINCLQQSLIMS
ncbi:MAG: hypothetical protein ACKPGT_08275 [Microcystis sp.]